MFNKNKEKIFYTVSLKINLNKKIIKIFLNILDNILNM